MAAQQRIAQGIENKGLGNGGGMLFGMNLAQSLNPMNASAMQSAPVQQPAAPTAGAATGGSNGSAAAPQRPGMSVQEQVNALKQLKELVDVGILSPEEFETKKKEILGL